LRALIRGQLNGAVAKFNMALKRNPHLSMAYRGLGLAYEKSGKGALAKEAFKRYLKMRPNAPDAAAIRKRIEGP
jgi:Flp pilus assembly protein TadD